MQSDQAALWCHRSTFEFCRALGSCARAVGGWAGHWVRCTGLGWTCTAALPPLWECAQGARGPGSSSGCRVLDASHGWTHHAGALHDRVRLPPGLGAALQDPSDTGDLVMHPSPNPTPAISSSSRQRPRLSDALGPDGRDMNNLL